MISSVEALVLLRDALKTTVAEGDLVVFQTQSKHVGSLGRAIQGIHHLLKAANIAAVVLDEDVSIIVVPESRRVIAQVQDPEPTGQGSNG